MSNETVGPLRINALDLNELNLVLRQIQDRIDYCYGLRGVTTVYNRVRASSPVSDGDVLVSPATAAVLPGSVMYTDTVETVTALHTYDRDPSAPFAVTAASAVVTNLDADLVDGQHRVLTINADHSHQSTGAAGGQLDHGLALTGLTDDDHTQYALLAGRAAGQTLNGGTAASENLTLKSTAHATKGAIIVADLSPIQWKDSNGVVIHQFGA